MKANDNTDDYIRLGYYSSTVLTSINKRSPSYFLQWIKWNKKTNPNAYHYHKLLWGLSPLPHAKKILVSKKLGSSGAVAGNNKKDNFRANDNTDDYVRLGNYLKKRSSDPDNFLMYLAYLVQLWNRKVNPNAYPYRAVKKGLVPNILEWNKPNKKLNKILHNEDKEVDFLPLALRKVRLRLHLRKVPYPNTAFEKRSSLSILDWIKWNKKMNKKKSTSFTANDSSYPIRISKRPFSPPLKSIYLANDRKNEAFHDARPKNIIRNAQIELNVNKRLARQFSFAGTSNPPKKNGEDGDDENHYQGFHYQCYFNAVACFRK